MVDEKGDWLDRLLRPFFPGMKEEKKQPDLAYAATTALEIDIERRMAEHGYTQCSVRVEDNATVMRFYGKGRRAPVQITIETEEPE